MLYSPQALIYYLDWDAHPLYARQLTTPHGIDHFILEEKHCLYSSFILKLRFNAGVKWPFSFIFV